MKGLIKIFLLFSAVGFGPGILFAEEKPLVSLSGNAPGSKPPERIVTLAPSITEIVFALGLGQRVKGVTIYSNFPPEVVTLPKVGSYVQLDIEKIVALRPDVCIGTRDGNPGEAIERLTGLGIPVYIVNPRSLVEVMETLLELGNALGAADAANRLVSDMRRRLEAVQTRVAGEKTRPRVFFQIGVSPIVSVGSGTFLDELIRLAGGTNLSGGDVAYPRFSVEQVLGLEPDLIVITSMARGEIFEQVKHQWRRWKQMPAVRDDRIFLIDSDLVDRPTPRLIDGLEMLAKMIHPAIFKAGEPQ
jgi:iron complex transport system substrate-binding protein